MVVMTATPANRYHDLPTFPAGFDSLDHARDVLTPFFDHYNHQHAHSGIGLMTPTAVRRGQATTITTTRALTLNDAFTPHSQRFKGKPPLPLPVPDKSYINPSRTEDSRPQKTA